MSRRSSDPPVGGRGISAMAALGAVFGTEEPAEPVGGGVAAPRLGTEVQNDRGAFCPNRKREGSQFLSVAFTCLYSCNLGVP